MALAVTLSGFAAVMILRENREPQVFGTEHLAVFAQPARLHEARVRALAQAAAPPPAPLPHVLPPAIDYAPTAAIAPTRTPVGAAVLTPPAAVPAQADRRSDASADRAAFRGPAGDIVVKRGSLVFGPGRVTAITQRGKKRVTIPRGRGPARR